MTIRWLIYEFGTLTAILGAGVLVGLFTWAATTPPVTSYACTSGVCVNTSPAGH